MGSRKSIIREAIERLDSLMAIGQSRFQAKQAKRAASPDAGWTVSTGKIHSHTTRKVYQQHVLAVVQGRAPHEKVFDHIPKHMDVHSYRRDSAQQRYLQHAPDQALPPVAGRLKRDDYDPAAVQELSWALWHNRLDVVLKHYLR